MSVDFNDPNQLELVLEALQANNTEIIREAEKTLKPFMKNVSCIPALLQQVQHSTKVGVRHVSALILKKKINTLFSRCQKSDQSSVKNELLQLAVSEPVKVVRSAIIGVISSLARNVFSVDGDWPEVFNLLMELLQHSEPAMRELCFNLISQLSEYIADYLIPHTETIAQMICSGCADSTSAVAVAALGAAASYIQAISEDKSVMIMQATLSPMLEVMYNCGDEDVVCQGLEVFQECTNMKKPLINEHVEHIVPFAVQVMKTVDYDVATRNAAGQTVLNIVEYRPNVLSKKKLIEPILGALLEMIASTDSSGTGTLFSMAEMQPQEDDDDDDDYTPEMETQEIAQMCLDKMAFSIKSKHFVPPALRICAECMDSSDAKTRKAACAMLGIIVEGCADSIRPLLGEILPKLCQSTSDPEYFVRECACFALGQFSEHCQPDILYHHQDILRVIFTALEDPRPTVQSTSCYVLENFCENLEPLTLVPFLPTLMSKLVALLSSSQRSTQEMALAAISAAAVASESNFLPYVSGTVEMLNRLLFITEPHLFDVRGRALECLGHIAVAVGKEHFYPYFSVGMQSAMEGTKVEGSLCEYSYTYIANTAKVMGDAFNDQLPSLVPHLLDVIRESELSAIADEDDVLGDDSDEDEDYDSEQNFHLNVEEGFINSKKAALSAIGSLAEHTGEAFFPFLEDTLNTLIAEQTGTVSSFHRIIRAESYTILQYMLKVACKTSGPTEPPAQGQQLALDPIVTEVSHVVITCYLTAMVNDIEMLPTSSSIEGMMGVLDLIGVTALTLCDKESNVAYGDALVENIDMILQEKASCQKNANLEPDDDDDDGDHDNLVMDATCDLLSGMAKVIGPGFIQYFERFKDKLLRFTKPSRSYSDRAMVIGCFAEVMKEIGPQAAVYADTILPIAHAGLGDQMESVRRNSAYCLAVLAEILPPETLAPHVPQMLQWLHPLCVRKSHAVMSDTGGADVDNALSAVARMMKSCPSSIPMQHVLPVLLSAMPLRSDYNEAIYIYEVLAQLVHENEATLLSMMPQLLSVYAQAIDENSRYKDDVKALVVTSLKFMSNSPQHQSILKSGLEQLTDISTVEVLHSALSQ